MTSVEIPYSVAAALPSLVVLDITNDVSHELDAALVAGHEVVGLTAGASTPEELVQRVVGYLYQLGHHEFEEVEVAREDVHFRLPREVTA